MAALLPRGDIVLDLVGKAVARYKACSRLLWARGLLTHYDIDILFDGRILVPNRHRRYKPFAVRPSIGPGPSGYGYEDTVVALLPEGEWLEERSAIEVFARHGVDWLCSSGPGFDLTPKREDILHANDVKPLDPAIADPFPLFNAGDLLLSLRNVNTIVFDSDDLPPKWWITGRDVSASVRFRSVYERSCNYFLKEEFATSHLV